MTRIVDIQFREGEEERERVRKLRALIEEVSRLIGRSATAAISLTPGPQGPPGASVVGPTGPTGPTGAGAAFDDAPSDDREWDRINGEWGLVSGVGYKDGGSPTSTYLAEEIYDGGTPTSTYRSFEIRECGGVVVGPWSTAGESTTSTGGTTNFDGGGPDTVYTADSANLDCGGIL